MYFLEMSSYPTMLTPPSSNEDSPPIYFVSSPASTSFQGPENYDQMMEYTQLDTGSNICIDPAGMDIEHQPSKIKNLLRCRMTYKETWELLM